MSSAEGKEMARTTGVKTRDVKRQLRSAGFSVVRNPGGHEIWARGSIWTRVASAHTHMDANELQLARRAIAAARGGAQRRHVAQHDIHRTPAC